MCQLVLFPSMQFRIEFVCSLPIIHEVEAEFDPNRQRTQALQQAAFRDFLISC